MAAFLHAAWANQAAFNALVQRSRPRLLRYAYSCLRDWDEAEDALQQALLQSWLHPPRCEIDPLAVLCKQIRQAIRRQIVHDQRQKRPPTVAIVDALDEVNEAFMVGDALQEVLLRDEFKRAVSHLNRHATKRGEHLFYLHFYLGWTMPEIRARYGFSISALNNVFNYWRSRLPGIPESQPARGSTCPHGHPYDARNTYRSGNKRECRACRSVQGRAAYEEKKRRQGRGGPNAHPSR